MPVAGIRIREYYIDLIKKVFCEKRQKSNADEKVRLRTKIRITDEHGVKAVYIKDCNLSKQIKELEAELEKLDEQISSKFPNASRWNNGRNLIEGLATSQLNKSREDEEKAVTSRIQLAKTVDEILEIVRPYIDETADLAVSEAA